MTDHIKTEKTNGVNLDEILFRALAQKEALLSRVPKLIPLQEEIDRHLSPEQPLGERFLTMGIVYAQFQGTAVL